jgi:hypothetical protein
MAERANQHQLFKTKFGKEINKQVTLSGKGIHKRGGTRSYVRMKQRSAPQCYAEKHPSIARSPMMALTAGMKRTNSAMGWPMSHCLPTGRQFKADR